MAHSLNYMFTSFFVFLSKKIVSPINRFLAIVILSIVPMSLSAQRVGLVLSGGGASGFAHIGVLKALEENNIPIDYITGTSAGALVGSMYACGYTPSEIEAFVLSEKFQLMTSGDVEPKQEFLLREPESNSDMISFSFSKDSIFKKSLPTNFVRSELMDFEMLRFLGMTSAAIGDDFDSLFVPFRCVASDIAAKKSTVFNHVHLNQAVRASMTFPFFINPIRVNGVLYFDGGLYNNFPADVMYSNFVPDYIIGSNVSYNAEPPTEDDLISQITNMLVSYSDFSLPCEEGIMIQPKTTVKTFDFNDVKKAINDGYQATLLQMDSIKLSIEKRVTAEELTARRAAFRKKIPPLLISEVNTRFKNGIDQSYVRKSILKNSKQQLIGPKRFERRYFRTYATPQIQYLYPTLKMSSDTTYSLDLYVKKSKDFRLDIGGLVCSRAVNMGFVQVNYVHLGRAAVDVHVNSYFGKFYGSGKAVIDVHLPSYYPLSFSAYGVLNRWDYFRSFATFFEDVKPSFLVQNEQYYGLQFRQPILNNSKSTLDFRHVELEDKYYQTEAFTNKDTADVTRFKGNVLSWTLEQNSLNRKQFASEGTLFMIRLRYVQGVENSISGSTASETYDYRKNHSWINFNGEFKTFPFAFPHFKFGIHAVANVTSQSLFKNYTASILSMNSFQPIPDMQTYFLPEYRSPQHIGAGINIIFSVFRNIDIRFDGYLYQPFVQLVIYDDATFGYSKLFKGETQVASLSGIYHSPVGPLRLTLNYFPQQKIPLSFQASYGYVLFNERATR
jgi:NTE family protein